METNFPVATVSQHEQLKVESQVFRIYHLFGELPRNAQSVMMELQRDNHVEYLTSGLRQLPTSFCVLDANRPWVCYWILHSLALLGECVDDELEHNAIDFLSRCQDPNGGYGGGPGQMPHLATTYAAVNALVTIGGDEALSSINRGELYKFLRRMKHPSGGFSMHDGGEIDVRACYTAISVASILNILDDDLVQNVDNFILSCQTYEGGISGEPGSEAHGGYTFCGVATMVLINQVHRLDLPRLIDWLVFRQGKELGFQGRTNKLVDGCYSFWQGGCFPLLQRLRSIIDEQLVPLGGGRHFSNDDPNTSTSSSISEAGKSSEGTSSHVEETFHSRQRVNLNDIGYDFARKPVEMGPLFHSMGLQQYLLLCSQDVDVDSKTVLRRISTICYSLLTSERVNIGKLIWSMQDERGGMRDKPGMSRDFYHTCYCLSGLSVCQHMWLDTEDSPVLPSSVMGPYSNLLEPTHPLFNVVVDQYHEAREFFTRD